MKLQFTSLFAGLVAAVAVQARAKAGQDLDVDVSVQWPESNAFGRIINGGTSNQLNVRLSNHAGEEIIVTRVFGAYREPHGRERALRNTTTLALKQTIAPGAKSPLIPYKFHSENKIGEVGLRVWVEYLDAARKPHVTLGFEGTGNVVEPKGSWFDPALLFSYLVVFAALAGIGNLLYGVYFPAKSTSSKGKKPRAVKPAAAAAATAEEQQTAPGAVDNDWIPAHHLKATQRKGYTSATSGDESEGASKKKTQKRGGRR